MKIALQVLLDYRRFAASDHAKSKETQLIHQFFGLLPFRKPRKSVETRENASSNKIYNDHMMTLGAILILTIELERNWKACRLEKEIMYG